MSLLTRGLMRTSAVKSLAPVSSRFFGAYGFPQGPRTPDNVYRRPLVPEPTAPLHENDPETWWHDGEAPEPLLDHTDLPYITPKQALAQLIFATVSIFGTVYGLISVFKPNDDELYAVPREYPFDNLRLSFGGLPAAAAKQEESEQM